MMKVFKITLAIIVVGCLISLYADQQVELSKQEPVVIQVVESKSEVVVKKIQLFMYDGCSYCVKVITFLQKYNLLDKVEFIDAGVTVHRDLLKTISGKTQAPYLVDIQADVKMPESDDIIKYLMKKFKVEASESLEELLVMSPLSNAQDTQKIHNPATFLSDVKLASKPVIILVSTTWCPPCKALKPIFLEVASQMRDLCEFILVDGDANQEIVRQLGVRGYPTIVCYKNGKRIDMQDYRNKQGLVKLVQILLNS